MESMRSFPPPKFIEKIAKGDFTREKMHSLSLPPLSHSHSVVIDIRGIYDITYHYRIAHIVPSLWDLAFWVGKWKQSAEKWRKEGFTRRKWAQGYHHLHNILRGKAEYYITLTCKNFYLNTWEILFWKAGNFFFSFLFSIFQTFIFIEWIKKKKIIHITLL